MKKLLTFILAAFLLPSTSFAAIAFDAASTGTSGTHTTSGTNRIMFGLAYDDSGDNCAAPTYNSVAMTLIDKIQTSAGNNEYAYVYYLVNPALGANTYAFSGTGCNGTIVSYTGASQTGVPDSTAKLANSDATHTVTTTVVASNSWIVGSYAGNRATSMGTGTTCRGNCGAQFTQVDSGAAVASGSQSLSVVQGGSPAIQAMVIASFAPHVDAPVIVPNFGDLILFE